MDDAVKVLSIVFKAPRRLEEEYIPREKAEESIRKYIDKGRYYLVVSAPKGSGKTTIIHHVLEERGSDGVLLVKVENKDGMPDIEKLVVQALGVSDGKVVGGSPMGFVVEVFKRFAEEHDGRKGLIVINVEGDRTTTEEIGSLAKQLGHFQKTLFELDAALTIADISAITLASGMTHDPRAIFVDIPCLTTEQALCMLSPYAQELQKQSILVKDVVSKIGGNPAWLFNVVCSSEPQRAIDKVVSNARAQVESLVRKHPEYKKTLEKLAAKGDQDAAEAGMLESDFNRLLRSEVSWWEWCFGGSDEPNDVISVSQKYRVVHLDLETGRVIFHTHAHYECCRPK